MDCSGIPEWDATTVYEDAGIRVVYNNLVYETNWYSSGQNPEENSGDYEVWSPIGTCDSGSTPAPATEPPTPAPTAVTTQAPQTDLGDVNDDGAVDIVDALLIAQYYVGLNPSAFNYDAADTNCDGSVDIVDALLVAQFYVGLVSGFC